MPGLPYGVVETRGNTLSVSAMTLFPDIIPGGSPRVTKRITANPFYG